MNLVNTRFQSMVKLPEGPVAKRLAELNVTLKTPLVAPASAPAEVVLAELDEKGALIDLLRLLSILLPARERVWWACLAARDLVGAAPENATPSLLAAEAWVFRPSAENRIAAQEAVDLAGPDDETVNCALSVVYSDGTLGPKALAQYPAPLGAATITAFGVVVTALGHHADRYAEYGQLLIDRAVNIGRGGNGKLEVAEAAGTGEG
jgi:hypothetical protein